MTVLHLHTAENVINSVHKFGAKVVQALLQCHGASRVARIGWSHLQRSLLWFWEKFSKKRYIPLSSFQFENQTFFDYRFLGTVNSNLKYLLISSLVVKISHIKVETRTVFLERKFRIVCFVTLRLHEFSVYFFRNRTR